MRQARDCLILFTRYPVPGDAKTRLIPSLGAEGAALLQRRMTEHALTVLSKAARRCSAAVWVCHAGGSRARMQVWLGPEPTYVPQGQGDLGDRMHRAFKATFAQGFRRVVIAGSDCPGITPDTVRNALVALEGQDLVLGPASDGGYYAIGLTRPHAALFREIEWGTPRVLNQSVRAARGEGLGVHLLAELDDVDTPEDLGAWDHGAHSMGLLPARARLSVVIPTLNEEEHISEVVQRVRAGQNVQTIVVDGGSADGTVEAAAAAGATVIRSRPSRARQQNAGAERADGEVLFFLHGDTILPRGFDASVRAALMRPGVVGGAFGFGVDADGGIYRLIERLANLRSRRLLLPYGDQGVFVRRDIFRRIGGFPLRPIMEDYLFAVDLRRYGHVVTLRAQSCTSARRWRRFGPVRTTLVNQLMIAGHYLGVPPEKLASLYRRGL